MPSLTTPNMPATSVAVRRALGAAFLFCALSIGAQAASAASLAVQNACMSDYFAYCSQHDPDGSGVRRCMKAAGPRLSKGCVNALIAAGEVARPKAAAANRSPKSRRKST